MDLRSVFTFGTALALGGACATPSPPERDPQAPRVYRVLRGETLATIASKRSSTAEQLRAWNDLPPGEPPPGTILLIYPRGTVVPAAQVGTPGRPMVINDPEPIGPAPEPSPRPPDRVAVTVPERGPPGLLGADVTAPALPTGGANGPVHKGHRPGTISLGPRASLATGPEADHTAAELGRSPLPAPANWRVGVPGALSPPPARPCLPPPTDAAEGEVVTARGLTKPQIKAGMRPVVVAAGGCLAGDGAGAYQVTLEVVAGCDGRAAQVTVADDGGLPGAITACIAGVARNAGFDPHDDVGGTVFLYPIRFER